MTFRVHHPIFARVYSRVSKSVESAGEADHRRRLLAELVGSVIEVGAGNGLNFPYYPSTVSEVIAVEPEPYLRERAKLAARHSTVRISIVEGDAEHLPLEYTSVDAAVVSLVLCSVADQHASLIEIRRVLRPGGELRFYEHVLASEPRLARLQKLLEPLWTRLAGGCKLTRNTLDAIRGAGFVVDEYEQFQFQPCLATKLAAPHILGRAHKP